MKTNPRDFVRVAFLKAINAVILAVGYVPPPDVKIDANGSTHGNGGEARGNAKRTASAIARLVPAEIAGSMYIATSGKNKKTPRPAGNPFEDMVEDRVASIVRVFDGGKDPKAIETALHMAIDTHFAPPAAVTTPVAPAAAPAKGKNKAAAAASTAAKTKVKAAAAPAKGKAAPQKRASVRATRP